MENLEDNVSSSGFVSLLIQEENEVLYENSPERPPAQSDHTFMAPHFNQTMSIGPYLKEMDDLLKSCEELTCLTNSPWSESYENKGDNAMKTYSETKPQEYMSTSCMDTHEDKAEDTSRQVQLQENFDSYGASSSMPLTSAGNELSESMVEYEGQLLGMLDMLESRMEEIPMDCEPQDWTGNEEYVHIPKPFKETHATLMNFCVHQDDTRTDVCVTKGGQTQNIFSCDNVYSSSVKSLEKSSESGFCKDLHADQVELKPQLECTGNEQMMYEDTYKCAKEECMLDLAADNTGLLSEAKLDTVGLSCGANDLETLGSKLDKCIDEVQCLEQRRKELLAEVVELSGLSYQKETAVTNEQEDMDQMENKVEELIRTLKKEELLRRDKSKSELESLRWERAEEERKLWRVNVERQGLQNQLWKLKRRLFAIARECAHSQAALSAQHQHVEMLKKEQEELQSVVVQLSEDSTKLQMGHQQELLSLKAELLATSSSHMSNNQEEVTQCRRDSCEDIQKYLQDRLKALEERYEPILIALLKRREAAVDACTKVKEQAQELKVQMAPLRDEIQKLKLQKACLEEKLKLIHFQRKEDMGQYKEKVSFLEESCRELKMELKIQKSKTKEMEALKESLSKKLLLYRSGIENHTQYGTGRDKELT